MECSHLRVSLHMECIHLIEYKRDSVLADEAELGAQHDHLLQLLVASASERLVLCQNAITFLHKTVR